MNAEIRTERLVSDLKNVVRDAEDFMKSTADDVSDKVREARERLAVALEAAQEACERLEDKALTGARATDRAIREHPYQTVGIAFGIGVLLGVLVGRR